MFDLGFVIVIPQGSIFVFVSIVTLDLGMPVLFKDYG